MQEFCIFVVERRNWIIDTAAPQAAFHVSIAHKYHVISVL